MNANGTRETFEGWAFLELMGHRRLAGKVSEATIAGVGFIRLDVPAGCDSGVSAVWCSRHGNCRCPDREDLNDPACPLHNAGSDHAQIVSTHYYAPGSVYGLHPTTEELATRFALRTRPAPVEEWELPKAPALPARVTCDAQDDECSADDPRTCDVDWHRERAAAEKGVADSIAVGQADGAGEPGGRA
jgi:hypothetical protein